MLSSTAEDGDIEVQILVGYTILSNSPTFKVRVRHTILATSPTFKVRTRGERQANYLFNQAHLQSDNQTHYLSNQTFFQSKNGRLVYVSTLDGKLWALDAALGGAVVWNVNTGSGPMLSSSIHRLELTNNGQWVRMIPSLSGGLYRFNGDSIEPVPVTADNLLQSSGFLFSDDLVISGGKESQTYGVDARSGRVMWNFSVGHHDLKLMADLSSDCHSTSSPPSTDDLYFELKIIVPEGLFDTPVVSAWHHREGKMTEVDLFSGARMFNDNMGSITPSLYIGMHNKQLYIQESVTVQRSVGNWASNLLTDESSNNLRIPWHPVPATSTALGLLDDQLLTSEDPTTDDESQASTTAISVLYGSSYVNGNGFFFFSEESLKKTKHSQCLKNATLSLDGDTITMKGGDDSDFFSEEETPVQIIIVSLWFWWKEVLEVIVVEKHIPMKQDTDSGVDMRLSLRSHSDPGSTVLTPEFISRYLTDFDPVRCLGKGGFGIVFEAKNKIDDWHYAIKRIALPNRQESRDRVMREVKALAKLDHQHIASRMFLFIQMQLCRKESLREWLKDNVGPRDKRTVLNMFLQILDAVEYPSNIFFSLDGQIKVGDFGLVTAMVESGDQRTPGGDGDTFLGDEIHTAQVGTQLYMSPEQSKGLPYNYKVDIYSLGVILVELLVPFGTEMERIRTLLGVRKNKLPPHFKQDYSEEYGLLHLMLSHYPDQRPTTYGIRARAPFNQETESDEWHFDLPSSRRRTMSNTFSNTSSLDSSCEQKELVKQSC
uniref:PRKR-like endoplasmic reticulum kinase n=1 Tax=Timema bartmani TaxID=61472 RepID=A0A7R9HYM5_9NEOP|nr:unnamed protein product [Timema bartmani]